MTSRNWVRLFFTTLLIGGITGIISGFLVRWQDFEWMFIPLDISEVFYTSLWLFGIGLIYSVISQMGFFSYLTIHRFGLGIFKSIVFWNLAQLILIGFVLVDLIYFDFNIVALVLLLYGVLVAFIKAKQTNKETFISALFFMTVFTTVELLAVLRVNNESWIYFMLISLLACNSYQLLALPSYLKKSQEEREQKKSKKPSINKSKAVKK